MARRRHSVEIVLKPLRTIGLHPATCDENACCSVANTVFYAPCKQWATGQPGLAGAFSGWL